MQTAALLPPFDTQALARFASENSLAESIFSSIRLTPDMDAQGEIFEVGIAGLEVANPNVVPDVGEMHYYEVFKRVKGVNK